MIENITEVALSVDETLRIRKQRILPPDESDRDKRICIVTGIHGDELEGQFVCYELIRRIQRFPNNLHAIVDVYPSMNPLGMDTIERGIPLFDLDMNRIFPGTEQGTMAEYVAAQIIRDVDGADACVDIHASNIFLRELPQVRVNEIVGEKLVPLAKELNTDLVWVHPSATVLESTFAHTMNSRGVPTFVVEMGVGMRITREYGDQLTNGILNLMSKLGFWSGPVHPPRKPIVAVGDVVEHVNASASGMFAQVAEHGSYIKKGEVLGELIDPLNGRIIENVMASCDGLLFTLREYPLVYEGALLARILKGECCHA